jgi:phosphoenolpyruvate synthase/pyruvate phosphate dikinase
MPVPPGFILSAETCDEVFNSIGEKELSVNLVEEYKKGIDYIEKVTGKIFGGQRQQYLYKNVFPLLLAIRSDASVQMPGMMDSVLNVGINDEVVDVLARMSGNPRWAYDTYRRFIQQFGAVVHSVPTTEYEEMISLALLRHGHTSEQDFTVEQLQELILEFKGVTPFPQNAWRQLGVRSCVLLMGITAICEVSYREQYQPVTGCGGGGAKYGVWKPRYELRFWCGVQSQSGHW